MTVMEQRVEAVEKKVDRLEVVLEQFMRQTGNAIARMESEGARYREKLDRTFERMEAEGARYREKIDGTFERMEAEGARYREKIDGTFERIDHTIERMEAEGAKDREDSARYREKLDSTIARMEAEGAKEREDNAREREKSALDREESAGLRREMNKRWGELANKMGTIVEDIIGPSLQRIARTELGCGEESFFAVRIPRTRSDDRSLRREFDAIYVGEHAVLLNETKSTPHPEDAQTFVKFLRSGEFALYFPEYAALPVIPVFSSLSIPATLVTYLTKNGIYAVAMGEEAAEVLNLAVVRGQQAG